MWKCIISFNENKNRHSECGESSAKCMQDKHWQDMKAMLLQTPQWPQITELFLTVDLEDYSVVAILSDATLSKIVAAVLLCMAVDSNLEVSFCVIPDLTYLRRTAVRKSQPTTDLSGAWRCRTQVLQGSICLRSENLGVMWHMLSRN